MTDAETTTVTVTRRDNEAKKVEVDTRRRSSEYTYYTTYTFNMDGSTAVLGTIEPDGEKFNVQGNADTARLARNAVCDLPFVQAVVMFPQVEA